MLPKELPALVSWYGASCSAGVQAGLWVLAGHWGGFAGDPRNTLFLLTGDNIICGSYDSKLAWFDLDLSTRPYQMLR